MAVFWKAISILVLTSLILLITVPTVIAPDITVYDLETECRGDQSQQNQIIQNRDGSFTFEGQYYVNSPASRIDYDYIVEGNEITIDVITTRDVPVDQYSGDCRGIAKYDLRTDAFDEGRYTVTLKHDGEIQRQNVYRVR